MPTNESIPVWEPADRLEAVATAAVRGRRFVAISADIPGGPTGTENPRVAECGAGVKAFGVAVYDAPINGLVPLHNDHSVVLMPVGAAVVAGQEVQSDAQGRPIPLAAGRANGMAVSSQATVDSLAAIKLYS